MSIVACRLGEMDEQGAGGIVRSIPEEPSVGYVPDEPTGVRPKKDYVPDDPTT